MKHIAKGQALAEVVVAIGVIVLLVTGLVVSTSSTLKASQYGSKRTIAVKYAQEAIEKVRNIRDTDWANLTSFSGTTQCLNKDGQWSLKSGACGVNIDPFYTREVTFTWDDPKMKVDVVVSWSDGAKVYSVPVSTYFTQWR